MDLDKSLEILYEGWYYDVTDFVNRHPGGDVILFYTEVGEDATQAIQQFHNRSIDKIHLMLKSFKRRPADGEQEGTAAVERQSERHQALTRDFSQLFLDMKNEGLFEPSYWRIVARMGEILGMIGLSVMLMKQNNTFLQVLGALMIGIAGGRAGWLTHEAGHHSLTGRPKVDRLILSAWMGVFAGIPGGWWARRHNKHHAMPQRLAHDIDMNTMPLLANHVKMVRSEEDGKSFWIQNQTWLFLSMDCFVGYMAWRMYAGPKSALKHGNYFDLLCVSIHWYMCFVSFPSIWTGLLGSWFLSAYMWGNFALSHTHLPVVESPTHWVEYALTHTSNVKSSLLVDWWMGYLNFQIEHHLFPTLPQYKSYLIRDRVQALAAKHNLPYHELSYMDAWAVTLKNFEDVAKHFRT